MRYILLAIGAMFGMMSSAHAIQISAFSQTSNNNTVVATANGTQTATSLLIDDAAVNISQLFGNVTPILANFSLTASSTDAAQTVFGLAVQHFSGNFCLTSGINCTGVNLLSGVFTDAAVGALGGPGLVVNVNNPPDTLTLSSSVIPAIDLNPPNTFNLGFSNLSPLLGICGDTLCSFTSSVVGSVSANTIEVPEPMTMAMLGVGLLGLGIAQRKKWSQ